MPPTKEVVVITGASAGVGRAAVRRFARQGARLGLLGAGRRRLGGARFSWVAVPRYAWAPSRRGSSCRR